MLCWNIWIIWRIPWYFSQSRLGTTGLNENIHDFWLFSVTKTLYSVSQLKSPWNTTFWNWLLNHHNYNMCMFHTDFWVANYQKLSITGLGGLKIEFFSVISYWTYTSKIISEQQPPVNNDLTCNSASVGFCPSVWRTRRSWWTPICPSWSLSNCEKAFINSLIWSSPIQSDILSPFSNEMKKCWYNQTQL